MHSKKSYTKKSTRIFAFLMCMILLLNMGCAYADGITTSGLGKAERDYLKWQGNNWFINLINRWLEIEENGSFKVEPDGYTPEAFRVTNINARESFLKEWYLVFKLSDNAEAGAYKVSVFYKDLLDHNTYLKFKLGREQEIGSFRIDDQNTVPLCVTDDGDTYGGLPKIEDVVGSAKDTSVNVILEKDYLYGIHFDNPGKTFTKNRPITVVIQDITPNQGGKKIYYSNIPSGYVSMRCALENDNSTGRPANSEFQALVIEPEVIDYYLRLWGFKRKATDSVESLPVESAAAALIIFFGQMILSMGEDFLNVGNLTLDNLIFNRLQGNAQPEIDLRGLGRNTEHRKRRSRWCSW